MPDLSFESKFNGPIAGVDEAGRGPWSGPVVAAAVILDYNNIPLGLNDSKKLTQKKRELLFSEINKTSIVGIGISTVEEIDEINILQASLLAMKRSIQDLSQTPDLALIDGNKSPQIDIKTQTIVKGDSKSLSIAAASIIAKVTRDRIMSDLNKLFPQYGWLRNQGYGTKEHQEAIKEHGITEHHRKSFKPIREHLNN